MSNSMIVIHKKQTDLEQQYNKLIRVVCKQNSSWLTTSISSTNK